MARENGVTKFVKLQMLCEIAGVNKKGGKVTVKQKTILRHCETITNAHLQHFSAHSVMFKLQ